MARAIDKDYLLKHKRKVKFFGIGSDDESWGYAVPTEVIEKAPTLTPPNEWVSVEAAVPDPGERVLATDGIFVGEAYRTSADSWHRHTGFPWRDGVTGRTVKYWMLLPAPPGKGNNVPTDESLTLEQLREMDGDKIAIHYIGDCAGFYEDEIAPYYGDQEQYIQRYNGMLRACDLPLKYYGTQWTATLYRRPPEGEA